MATKKRVKGKAASKKAVAKKTATRKSPVKKTVAKKAASRKTTIAKSAAKKTVRKPAPLRDGRAPNSPWMIPTLTVKTCEAAIAFYKSAFGFSVDFTMPGGPEGRIGYAQLHHHGGLLHLAPEGAYGGTTKAPASSAADCPAMLYVYCGNVDAFTKHARAAGAKVLNEPTNMFWGDRTALFQDIDGYRWAFATNIAAFDPAKGPPADYPPKHEAA